MAEPTEYLDWEPNWGDDFEGDEPYCWRCGGARFIITCPDDLCRGSGECMHGDGHRSCPECNKDGSLDWEY